MFICAVSTGTKPIRHLPANVEVKIIHNLSRKERANKLIKQRIVHICFILNGKSNRTCNHVISLTEFTLVIIMNDTHDVDGGHVTATSVAKALPLILITLAAFLENSLVLVSVAMCKSLRRLPGNIFIVNLAITDVVGSSLCMPFGVVTFIRNGHYMFGDALCQFQAFLIVAMSNVTFLTLLGYSIFRYVMITSRKQLSVSTLWRGVEIYIVSIWLVGVTFSSLPLLGWGKYLYFPSFYSCTLDWTADKSFSVTVFVVVFFIPQTMLLFSYYKISTFVRHHKRQLSKNRKMNSSPQSNTNFEGSSIAYDASSSQSSPPHASTSPSRQNVRKVFVMSIPEEHPSTVTEETQSKVSVVKTSNDTKGRPSLGLCLSAQIHPQRKLSKTDKKVKFENAGESQFHKPSVSRLRVVQQERLVKILLFTVLAFYICWMPFAVASFQQVIGHTNPRPEYFDLISMWLAFSNALCNPVIYVLLNGQFRKAFRHTFTVIFCCSSKNL